MNDIEEKIRPTYQDVTKIHQTEEPAESWMDNNLYKRRSSSLSSDSLSPKNSRHEVDGTSESPSGKFLQLVDNIDRGLTSSSSQTDLKDFVTTASQTELIKETEKLEKEISVADKATITDGDTHSDTKARRRKSGFTESQVPDIKTLEKVTESAQESSSKPTAEDSGKSSLVVEKERNLWRKKLSVAFKIPDEFAYESATSMALENSVGSSNFVDGVSLRVRFVYLGSN